MDLMRVLKTEETYDLCSLSKNCFLRNCPTHKSWSCSDFHVDDRSGIAFSLSNISNWPGLYFKHFKGKEGPMKLTSLLLGRALGLQDKTGNILAQEVLLVCPGGPGTSWAGATQPGPSRLSCTRGHRETAPDLWTGDREEEDGGLG